MKQIVGLFILLVTVMFLAAWLSKGNNSSQIFNVINTGPIETSPIPEAKKTVVVGNKSYLVEIADSQEERQKGLSERENLDKDTGMLFIFEKQNNRPPFWMKGMKIPIDIVWIDNDKVVQLNTDVQPELPDTPDNQLRLYTANQPVDYVLELAAGTVKEKKIRVGDKVEMPSL